MSVLKLKQIAVERNYIQNINDKIKKPELLKFFI